MSDLRSLRVHRVVEVDRHLHIAVAARHRAVDLRAIVVAVAAAAARIAAAAVAVHLAVAAVRRSVARVADPRIAAVARTRVVETRVADRCLTI